MPKKKASKKSTPTIRKAAKPEKPAIAEWIDLKVNAAEPTSLQQALVLCKELLRGRGQEAQRHAMLSRVVKLLTAALGE